MQPAAFSPMARSARGPRVLIVDPDDDTRALYLVALRLAGFDVAEAADGRTALTQALVQPPSLLVTELGLPLVNGFALCEILRRDTATRAVPILVITGEGRPGELNRVRGAGANTVLVKPVPPDTIVDEARHLIADARTR